MGNFLCIRFAAIVIGRKLTGEEMSKIPSYEYIMEFLSTPKILEIFDESVTQFGFFLSK